MDHGFEHLRCGDDHLTRAVAGADKALLEPGEALKLDLYAHVAARHHDAVRVREDLLEVIDPLVVFDLGDDADVMPAVVVEEAAHGDDILLAPHEGRRHEIDVVLDAEAQIRLVTRAHEGHIQVDIGQVDALVVGDLPADRHAADNIRLRGALHGEHDLTVVDEHTVAGIQLPREVGIGDAHLRLVADDIAARQGKEGAVLQRDLSVPAEIAEADLRPFGIQHDRCRYFQPVADTAEQRDGLGVLLMRAV